MEKTYTVYIIIDFSTLVRKKLLPPFLELYRIPLCRCAIIDFIDLVLVIVRVFMLLKFCGKDGLLEVLLLVCKQTVV